MAGKVKTRKILSELLEYLYKIFLEADIEFIIFYGTLLGLVRENDFIKDDDDIDILVDKKNFSKIISLINTLKIKIGVSNNDIIQLFMPNGNGPIDIYFYEFHQDDTLIRWDGYLLFSKTDIFPLKKITFNNVLVNIPYNSNKILTEIYGINYLVPIKKETYKWTNLGSVRRLSSESISSLPRSKSEKKREKLARKKK